MNIQQLCRMIAPAWVIACVATVSFAGPAAEAKDPCSNLMGFHFSWYVGSRRKQRFLLPWMSGSGYNEVTLFPNGIIALRMDKAAELYERAVASDKEGCHQTFIDYADLLRRMGRIGDAVRMYRKAVAAVPTDSEWRQHLREAEKELNSAPN